MKDPPVLPGTHDLEVYKRKDGLWDWRVVAANGQVVATSGGQGYTERNDAVEATWKVWPEDVSHET